jgi:hypothetical protein
MLRRFFRNSKSAVSGAFLDRTRCWEVPGRPIQNRIADALSGLLPTGSVVVLEATSIDPEVERSLRTYVVPAALEIRPGIGWPRSQMLHVGPIPVVLGTLSELIRTLRAAQICDHFYAYAGNTLLLEWGDAFDDQIFLAGTIPEGLVVAFCNTLGVGAAKVHAV